MSDEPKPCPFCGEPAEIDLSRGFRAFTSGNMESQVAIYCTRCSCDMSMCYSDFPEYDVDQLRAILIGEWNRRVPAPAVLDDVAEQVAHHLAVQMKNAGYYDAADYMMSEWIGRCIRAALTQPTGDRT